MCHHFHNVLMFIDVLLSFVALRAVEVRNFVAQLQPSTLCVLLALVGHICCWQSSIQQSFEPRCLLAVSLLLMLLLNNYYHNKSNQCIIVVIISIYNVVCNTCRGSYYNGFFLCRNDCMLLVWVVFKQAVFEIENINSDKSGVVFFFAIIT